MVKLMKFSQAIGFVIQLGLESISCTTPAHNKPSALVDNNFRNLDFSGYHKNRIE